MKRSLPTSSDPNPDFNKRNKDSGLTKKTDKEIISSLQDLCSRSKSSSSVTQTASSLGHANVYIEVIDHTNTFVLEEFDRIRAEVQRSDLNSNNHYKIPSRSDSNQIYLPELDRFVLKEKYSSGSFSKNSKMGLRMAQMMDLLTPWIKDKQTISKRNLFYNAPKDLFKTEAEINNAINDLACMLKCTRNSLYVTGSSKGSVGGNLTFVINGLFIDCSKMEATGYEISPLLYCVKNLESKALFILVIEKDASFQHVNGAKFYERFPCILITAKGQPDVATRLFLNRLKTELKLPVFALVDMDPYGLRILLVYRCGSKEMSYDSSNLTTPEIHWLGLRPADIEQFGIPEKWLRSLTDGDRKTAKNLLKGGSLNNKESWSADLMAMLEMGTKVGIESIGANDLQFLTEGYLRKKLENLEFM